MTKRRLVLAVKRRWWDDIQAGIKDKEYREDTPYWRKRLEGREYDEVEITLGYPRRDDASHRRVFPWNGFTKELLTHEHFGNVEKTVFAINLMDAP